MIYTIGHRPSYLHYIRTDRKPVKLGVDFEGSYPGGYAFRTIEDAQRRIDEAYSTQDFAVFGLDCEWDNTRPSYKGWWHNLIEDAPILPLEEIDYE